MGTAHNLNPNDSTDRNNIGQDGYTQLEVYLNTLTGEIVTHSSETTASVPGTFFLNQNYPNPFNPVTTITYQIPTRSHVTLKVLDVLGREVSNLVDGILEPGYKSARWDASKATSGVYFYQLRAATFVETRKMLLVK